jgi:hypothetical protein
MILKVFFKTLKGMSQKIKVDAIFASSEYAFVRKFELITKILCQFFRK